MIVDFHGRVNSMGDGLLSYLAVIAIEVTQFGEGYRNDI